MSNFRKSMRICAIHLVCLCHDSRIILCVTTIFLLIVGKRTNDLRSFCVTLNVRATPFPLFVIITESLYNQKLLLLLFLMIICDAPFIDGAMVHYIQRTGRMNWFIGTLMYIITLVIGFWIIVFLACVVSILNCFEWSIEWGKVFLSIMKTGEIPDLIGTVRYIKIGSALKAFVICFCFKCLLTMLLAFITWLTNANTRKNYGVILPIILVMLHGHIVGWFVNSDWVYFSPVSLSNLNMLNIDGITKLPSVRYAVVFLTSVNLLAGYMLYRTSMRFSIETGNLVN